MVAVPLDLSNDTLSWGHNPGLGIRSLGDTEGVAKVCPTGVTHRQLCRCGISSAHKWGSPQSRPGVQVFRGPKRWDSSICPRQRFIQYDPCTLHPFHSPSHMCVHTFAHFFPSHECLCTLTSAGAYRPGVTNRTGQTMSVLGSGL